MTAETVSDNSYHFSRLTEELAYNVTDICRARGLRLATAESCTGGLIAAALTEINGSSSVVWGGIVSYSNAVKAGLLNVPQEMLDEHGAVSELVARAMAEGALRAIDADVAVSVTGIAGPDGGSAEKPVGLVHMAVAIIEDGQLHSLHREWRFGDLGRNAVRAATVNEALKMVYNAVANIKYVA